MRFRAEQHLRRPSEIRAVREQGKRVECRAFTIWWKTRATGSNSNVPDDAVPAAVGATGTDMPRVCVIASTAAVGNAVHRNRAKRRLREIFRHQQASVPGDCDMLLIARRAVTEWPMGELHQTFSEACRKISSPRVSP